MRTGKAREMRLLLLGWASLLCCCEIKLQAAETDHLSYYETLSYVHVSSHVKRSSPTQADLVKKVNFHAFQRDFHLTLKSGASVLAPNFQARLIHKDGSSTKLSLDQSEIFTGYDTDNRLSTVHAHLEESLWSIHIFDKDEIYAIEPAWRILRPFENPLNDTMIAYRLSDLKDFTNGQHFCSASGKQEVEEPHQDLNQNSSQDKVLTYLPHVPKREKRSRRRKVCTIYMVGDADFFKKRCRSNKYACLSLLVHRAQFANEIYLVSQFEDRYGRTRIGIGLQIAELVLLAHYETPGKGFKRHFNEYGKWDSSSKLDSFAWYVGLARKRYCLNHLFTEFSDEEGVLGLAYVNQLCRWGRKRTIAFNSGITSGTNKVGFLIPSLTQSIVFTHGHNFGAHHDPDTKECAPSAHEGGKFIMWEYAVNGYDANNLKFSKCSLREIGRRVPAICFKSRSRPYSFCGNGIVDGGEECDAGFVGLQGVNKCCTKTCLLRVGAFCSEVNHECCVKCHIAPSTTLCQDHFRSHSCKNTSYCSGTSLECIDGGFLQDGTKCGEFHECFAGKCQSPCEVETRRLKTVELKPCYCKENASEACMWCCFNATDPAKPGKCKPLRPDIRRDGTQCFRGTCESGGCVTDIRFRTQTILQAYINFVQLSSLENLLKANIVLLVVVFSLILWVPASLYISHLDRKFLFELELEAERSLYESKRLQSLGKRRKTQDTILSELETSDSDDSDWGTMSEKGTVVSFRISKDMSVASSGGFSSKLARSSRLYQTSKV